MPRKTYFSDLYLTLSQHEDWLRKKDNITGQCSYCTKDFDVSNMRESALNSYNGSKKNQSRSSTEQNNSLSKIRKIKR